MDKPIISKCISGKTRVYYIDVREDCTGLPYITITEIIKRNASGDKRQRVFVHADYLEAFLTALQDVSDAVKRQ